MTWQTSEHLRQLGSGHPRLQNVLKNLESDWVTDPSVFAIFKIEWDCSGVLSPDEALALGDEVIESATTQRYVLQSQVECGNDVSVLFRIQEVAAIKYLIPNVVDRQKVYSKLGITKASLNDGSVSEIKKELLARELAGTSVTLGNKRGVTWAASHEDLQNDMDTPRVVAARLGLDRPFPLYIMVVYDRRSINGRWLIPGALDGFVKELYAMAPEGSNYGMTKPLTPELSGVREGVHEGGEVLPKEVLVR